MKNLLKNGTKIVNELNSRKKILIQQLKELNKEENTASMSKEEYEHKKREIESELIEIMDRLTQLAYILKT